ncbi:MAG: hypothetical protein JW908_07190 [Anaerolineales bacterium]|nr:hypothetical protein [Anaerolineales bacterium]
MSKSDPSLRRKTVAFSCFLCFVEGIACVLWLALIPGDAKNAILWGFSSQRLMISAIIVIGSIGFLILSSLFWRKGDLFDSFFIAIKKTKYLGWVNLALGISFLAVLGLLFFPPAGILKYGSAYHQRLVPLFIFILLSILQTIIVVDWLTWNQVKEWCIQTMKRTRRLDQSVWVSIGLLLLSVFIALTQVYYVYYNFGDEGTTLTTGWLISKGWVLHKEIFSHHFPFLYFFVALMVKLFGIAILPIRLSLIFFRTLVFAISMKFSRYRVALGITALAWSLIGHLYLGNILIYYSLSGFLLVCSIAIGLTLLNEPQKYSKAGIFTLSLFSGLAVMTDPFMLFPTAALLIIVMLNILFQKSNPTKLRLFIKLGAIVCSGYGAGLACYLIYALSTGSLTDFYHQAILFNAVTYSKYSPSINFGNAFNMFKNGLDIFNPLWFTNTSPFYTWDSYIELDAWVFTGFFYRFVILLASLFCLLKRRYLTGITLYVVASLVMMRATRFFYESPLVLLSIFICAWLLSGDVFSWQKVTGRFWSNTRQIAQKTIWVIVLLMFCWLNIRAVHFLFKDIDQLQYEYFFGVKKNEANSLKRLTCGNENARLLVYPYDPILYFLAQMPPASKFIYMLPWTVEIGQDEVIHALKEKPVMLYIDREANVWGYPVKDFLADLLNYVDNYYVRKKGVFLVSPSLAECK